MATSVQLNSLAEAGEESIKIVFSSRAGHFFELPDMPAPGALVEAVNHSPCVLGVDNLVPDFYQLLPDLNELLSVSPLDTIYAILKTTVLNPRCLTSQVVHSVLTVITGSAIPSVFDPRASYSTYTKL